MVVTCLVPVEMKGSSKIFAVPSSLLCTRTPMFHEQDIGIYLPIGI